MKGLFLKDFYFTRIAYLIVLTVTVLFAIVSYFEEQNSSFLIFYPIMISSIISVSTFNYEEKYKLNLFTESLPCSRSIIVSTKYIVTLIYTGITSLIMISVQIARILQDRGGMWDDITATISFIILVAVMPASLIIPFSFKFSATKAQYIVYFFIGAIFGFTSFSLGFTDGSYDGQSYNIPQYVSIILVLISIIILAISWLISNKIYNKRDLA